MDVTCMPSFLSSATLMSIGPNAILIGYGANRRLKHQSQLDPTKPAFFITDFFLRHPLPWIQYAHWTEIHIQDFKRELIPSLKSSFGHWQIKGEDIFYKAFEQLQEEFQASTLYKAVPYLFAHSRDKMTNDQIRHSLNKALDYVSTYPLYLYGHWEENGGILGLTPEILFDRSQSVLSTMALAGTSSKQCSENDFKKNLKEQQEHQWVIEGIKDSLSSWGNATVGALKVLSLPHLNHLMTPIEMPFPESISFEEAVRALHPTPALGAFPKQAGMQWLMRYGKQIERGWYGAPLGALYPQKQMSRCLVAIRNVQWNKKGMHIGAGCGIVKESQYEKEWNEVKLKIKTIQQVLDL